MDISGIELEYRDVPGAGKQIFAHLGREFNCVEFVMRGDVPQPIMFAPKDPVMVSFEPWIQFEPKDWSDVLDSIFSEIVELWNAKHAPQKGE